MHMTATLTRWYEEKGRHAIYAGGKSVPLDQLEHQLVLRNELVTIEEQHDLDRLGIAKNAREEKLRARDAQMMKLYRKHVLKEETPDLVQIGGVKPAPAEEREEVGSFGD
jgi:DNA repair ATPase RecN